MSGIQGIGGIPEPRSDRPSSVRDRDRQAPLESTSQDGVEISDGARQAAEVSRLLQLAAESPDVRTDRVAEAREQLEREEFRLPEKVAEVARQISNFLD
jgi:hypothetical protein